MMRIVRVLVVLAVLSSAGALTFSQQAELRIWHFPIPGALPAGLSIAPNGKVYISLFRAQKIGLLDPATNELSVRDIGASPGSIYAPSDDVVIYALPMDDTIVYQVFIGGEAVWQLPTAGAWPTALTSAPTGPGQINLWFAERTAGKVARLSPAQIAVTLPFFAPQKHTITPQVQKLTPNVVSVNSNFHAGNPLLPPPLALVHARTVGPVSEWEVTGFSPGYVEDVALAVASGAVWFTTDAGGLASLDPPSNTVAVQTLPPGAKALGVTVAPDGKVWFTDVGTPAIGVLDPVTGDVRLWPIPGGVQPLELLVEAGGNVWFIDREGDLVGFLRPGANEFVLYRLPAGSFPVDLELSADGSVWFVCERGNYVAQLSIIPVLGPPPVTPGAGAARILGYSIAQQGNRATIQVIYSYDGSLGFPVFVGLYVLPSGEGFSYAPYRIEHAGTGTATIELTYGGPGPATTEAIKLVIYLPGGQAIAEREVEFRATWTP
jgi:streptogramin lyase